LDYNTFQVSEIKQGVKNRFQAYRNPVYLLYALIAIPVFIIGALIAESGTGPIETAIFNVFNSMSDAFYWPFTIISIFGTIGMVIIISIIAIFRHHYGNATKILIAGIGAYMAAYWLKLLDIRARPEMFIAEANVREDASATLGFPSGHVAVATVLAMTAYQYLPKRYHRPVTILAFLVAISRMYLGVHLPLDLVGGFAIGLLFGGVVNFILGSRKFSPVDPEIVKEKVSALGVEAKSVKLAAVDARGSIPYFGVLKNGQKIFIKIVGKENNIADWLFKSWRRIIYRRLEDEAPFLNAKRQLEHEAYVSNLALLAGVRTPRVLGIFETEKDRWAHAQYTIDGNSLDSVDVKKLTDSVLLEIWNQVEIMHNASIVHKDLRCANVFLDDKNKPWIIDFGFSEGSMPDDAKNRDRAEIIASLSTLVGAEKSISIALKALGKDRLRDVAPYITTGVLSSATSKTLKKEEANLPKIRKMIAEKIGEPTKKPIKLSRFSLKKFLMVAVIAIGIYVLLPQIGSFEQSFSSLKNARLWLVAFAVLFSLMTYVFAAASYRALLYYPIAFKKMYVIQGASSFASKLAPAGTGGLALNARFLTKNGHTITQSTSIAAINNFMGFAGHMSLLLIVLLFGASSFSEAFSIKISLPPFVIGLIIGGILLLIGVLVYVPKYRKKITKVIKQIGKDFSEYRKNPSKLVGSYLASILVTLSYTGALYASAHALGATLSPLQILVVFTVGVATASVTPTPGGIGGAEAGLVAALTATGMDSSQALSITLLYRLATYWLPILPGFILFQYSVKKEYV
jgi:undecaprenyl-diphosphatase